MNKFTDQITKLELIQGMCNSLSSIAKYKYVKYLNKINYLKNLLNNIEKYLQKNDKIKCVACVFVCSSIGYYVTNKNKFEKYLYVFIICDYNTEKKIKNLPNNNNKYTIIMCSFNNKKIKEFKTNIYDGEILTECFRNINNYLKDQNALDVFYNGKFVKKYFCINKYNYDNNNEKIHIYSILFCIYVNTLIMYLCLNESRNLDEAIKKIKIQIIQTKIQYKNYKSKQHLFNICKFHS